MSQNTHWTRLLAVFLTVGLGACDSADDEGPSTVINADGGVSACADGVDNDLDGLTDFPDDPGCRDAEDPEEDDTLQAQCEDGVDNDEDGETDFPADPGCSALDDNDESDDPPVPQCRNGVDDDDDGTIDFPEDRGCAGANDDSEAGEPPLPACSNGLDDDEDGRTDFPQDPGCASDNDDDETDDTGPIKPQCEDGADNDNDGYVDLADPGCTSGADPREADGEEVPQCFNNIDDDLDGVIDYPYEPGCISAGDDDEADGAGPIACADGLDNDDDGLIDFPFDPGCGGVGDRDEREVDDVATPQCADGIDNDRDGRIDFPADLGCQSAADTSEIGNCGRVYEAVEVTPGRIARGHSSSGLFEAEGSCGGRGARETVFLYRVERSIEALVVRTDLPGNEYESTIYVRRRCLAPASEMACVREPLEDGVAANQLIIESPAPGDYYIFVDGATGTSGNFEVAFEEVPLAECLNGLDDDEDGRVDFPLDPGCDRASDRDETDPPEPPVCLDGQDNDGDGLTDFPLDPGCRSAGDHDEVDLCGQGVRFNEYPVGEPFIFDDSSLGGTQVFSGSCPSAGPERIYVYENPFNAHLVFSVDHPETIANTTLYVRSVCGNAGSELGCSAGDPNNAASNKGTLRLERQPPGLLYVVVDHPFGLGGQFKLSVDVERLPAGCSDAFDNDEDGFIDGDDLGCATPDDEDEADPPAGQPYPDCWDGEDNDEDGLADFPRDPGCFSKGDVDETDPAVMPICANGADDDEDGLADYPADPGCQAASDEDEADGRRRPRCANRVDDDQDGLTDFPNDPGCSAPGDESEIDSVRIPACADGQDNDRDGRVDFPFDPGCIGAGHFEEIDPEILPACGNGLDDDDDGVIDFPFEPGCAYAADPDETNAAFAPQCSNGNDDDQDGRIDWPDDPGCIFAADTNETLNGPPAPRCADGVDNDLDGFVDLTDPGCANGRDNDENDAEVPPLCADGLDNDEDGDTDWPTDPGCDAQGDECEQGGFGQCGGVCQDITHNNAHCGRCDLQCNAGIECIEGKCGELRPFVLACGRSNRPVQEFIRGELALAGVEVQASCVGNDEAQAMLVSRNGINDFRANAAVALEYLEAGGNIMTERTISDDVYNALFGANIAQGGNNGSCRDNIQPLVQLNADDLFWQENVWLPVANNLTGCGMDISNYPDVVVLGGWTPQVASLGYIQVGNGRLWLVESDWQDGDALMTDGSRDLMAAMIAHRGAGGLPVCSDGRDNDDDGLVDAEDPGCAAPDDAEEGDDPAELPACADGEDNDEDGVADFPLEPGCQTAGDNDEADPEPPAACSDGLDNDGNDLADYPWDPGCQTAGDLDERAPIRLPECGNGRDDDADGLADFPFDPGCVAAGDTAEDSPEILPECGNGEDDDGDGLVDWPFDRGCSAASDATELDPAQDPQCSDGEDNDEDGETDFPRDPGCAFAGDDDETDPAVLPECSDGRDNDGNERTDWPDDPGCNFAGDTVELLVGQPLPRCADGLDNDDDGVIDLADIGCENAHDDDEADLEEVPACADDADNDEDGQIDWPADDGCAAQGDLCEQAGFGLCGGVCEDLVASPLHCGRCDRACAEGVECIEGRCGGVRPRLMRCGNSSRNVNQFLRGGLVEHNLQVVVGCVGDEETQAVLVTRSGAAQFAAAAAANQAYVRDGGMVLTEYNISHTVFNALFGENVAQGARNGSCQDNVQPVVQFNPQDPFWQDNVFQALPDNQSGCGYTVNGFPGVTLLGGWNANAANLGYRDLGAGRLWLVDADWQDSQIMTELSLDLMAYMIAGGNL